MSDKADSLRILVVDDDKEMRDFLSDQLALRGFETELAQNGGEAIERVRGNHYDAVICDLKMPLIDGMACLEAITNLDPRLHVIMISGEATVENAVSAMKKGACDFLQKPIRMENLLFRIDKVRLKNQMDSITRLYEKSVLLLSHLSPDEMLRPMLKTVADFFHADESAWITADAEIPEITASTGLAGPHAYCAMLAAAERSMKNPAREAAGRLAVVPVLRENKLTALLMLNRTKDQTDFTLPELREAAGFGSQILQTIESSKIRKQLEDKVSQLRRAYEELETSKTLLAQRDKLSRLGTLIAGVAHEMNGPLTIMLGYTELVLRSSKTPNDIIKPLSIVHQEAERCRGMVEELLLFARDRKPHFQWTHLETIVAETTEALALDFKRQKVEVRVTVSERTPGLYADPDQLRQVLLNLLRNAAQAMTGQEKKRIDVGVSDSEKSGVRLTVRDYGPGITPENLKKIFDPYFTTKTNGGTGIGLSICSDIIRAHHGMISANSLPGEGASFCIELPQIQPDSHSSLNHAA